MMGGDRCVQITVSNNGVVLNKSGVRAVISAEQLLALQQQILSADFEAIEATYVESPRFCDSMVDGVDKSYLFHLPRGTVRLDTCRYTIPNQPPFTTLEKLSF